MKNKNKNHFIFLTTSDLSETGPSIHRKLALARGLVELNNKVSFLLFNPIEPKLLKSHENYKGVEFVNCLKPKDIVYKRRSVLARIHWALSFVFFIKYVNVSKKKNRTTICIVDGDNYWMTLLRTIICKNHRFKVFYLRSEDFFYGKTPSKSALFFEKLWHRTITSRLDHTFVISTALTNYYKTIEKRINRKIPTSILNIVVEPDTVINIEPMSSIGVIEDKRTIVYVGSMYGEKDGVYVLIEAFASIMVQFPDTILVLVGDNTRKDRMERINEAMKSIADKSRVVFTGHVARAEVSEIIRNAYCLTLSRPDNIQAKYGFPTKLGEYLATGRPVVITSVGDIPLFLKDQENAYLSKPDSVNDFAHKLSECLADPQQAQIIGENGQLLAFKEFNYIEEAKVITQALQKNTR